MTHYELSQSLAAHLAGNTARVIWTDMQLGPAGSVRPDVYTIDKSFVRFRAIAYECKVSVADFRADVTAGKWTRYQGYAHGVYFAVQSGLIRPADVPREAGLIVLGESGWRTARKPMLIGSVSMPEAAWLKLVIDGIERARMNSIKRRHDEYQCWRSAGHAVGKEIAALLSDRANAQAMLEIDIANLEARRKYVAEEHARLKSSRELTESAKINYQWDDLGDVLGIAGRGPDFRERVLAAISGLDVAGMSARLDEAADGLERTITRIKKSAAALRGDRCVNQTQHEQDSNAIK
jgi:hypothetical protein